MRKIISYSILTLVFTFFTSCSSDDESKKCKDCEISKANTITICDNGDGTYTLNNNAGVSENGNYNENLPNFDAVIQSYEDEGIECN